MIHNAIGINPNLTSEECGISEQRLDNMKHKVYSIIDKGNKEYNKKLNILAHTYYILDEEIGFQFKEEWLVNVF